MVIALLACGFLQGVDAKNETEVVCPNKLQVKWANAEMGVMLHFDIPIFNPGYNFRNWGTHPDASTFNPTELNTDQWVESAAKMGAKYVVLVAKHCSGFSLWPTKAHEYSVKNCPWKNGQGDIVKDFVASCKKYGVKPGLYASTSANGYYHVDNPGVVQKSSPYTQEEYNKVVETQLRELWSNYGDLFEVWFDGGVLAVDKGGADVLSLLKELQPKAIEFGSPIGFPNRIRWVGNEEGFSPDPCWATCDTGEEDRKFGGKSDAKHWNAGEADFTLRWNSSTHGGWMWGKDDEDKIFTLSQLMDKYEKSVGRNTNMLLGVVIDTRGLIPEPDVKRMKEFGDEIKRQYGTPLKRTKGKGPELTLTLKEPTNVDRLVLQEDIRKGERVLRYQVDGYADGKWVKLGDGTNIGHKRIIRFPSQKVSKLRLNVKECKAEPIISNFAVYSILN